MPSPTRSSASASRCRVGRKPPAFNQSALRSVPVKCLPLCIPVPDIGPQSRPFQCGIRGIQREIPANPRAIAAPDRQNQYQRPDCRHPDWRHQSLLSGQSKFGQADDHPRKDQPHRDHPPGQKPVEAVHPPHDRIGDQTLPRADRNDVPDKAGKLHRREGKGHRQRPLCQRNHRKAEPERQSAPNASSAPGQALRNPFAQKAARNPAHRATGQHQPIGFGR